MSTYNKSEREMLRKAILGNGTYALERKTQRSTAMGLHLDMIVDFSLPIDTPYGRVTLCDKLDDKL